uniref:BFN domain-containing protein n=2 Tax=Bursaphelenchus xylophilus TaxID=6326 RepID=A0A1I7SX10_BURXY
MTIQYFRLPKYAVAVYAESRIVCLIKCGPEKTVVTIPWRLCEVKLYQIDRLLLVHINNDKESFAGYIFADTKVTLSRRTNKVLLFARNQYDLGLTAVEIRFKDADELHNVANILKKGLEMAKLSAFTFSDVCPDSSVVELPPILIELVGQGPVYLFENANKLKKAREEAAGRKQSSRELRAKPGPV